jgi:hypothetical protein
MACMRRRDFVKAMVAVPVSAKMMLGQQTAPPQTPGTAAPPATAVNPREAFQRQFLAFKAPPITSVVPDAVAATEAHFFNGQQLATLGKLSEIMMPALNGYPGAIQAGAPEFIDFLVGVSPVDRQQLYQAGLDRLNSEAKKQFGVPFAEVSAAQADKLLRPLMVSWAVSDHPPGDHLPADPFIRFINIAHDDIRTATVNSQPWSAAAIAAGERAPGVGLYWSPIDPIIEGYV